MTRSSRTFQFTALPGNLEELKNLPEAALTDPFAVAALTVVALCAYPGNKKAAEEMLQYLQGPKELTVYDQQFLVDRFRGKDYVPRSYLAGTSPENDYHPEQPYRITVNEEAHSRDQEGYLTLYLQSSGADSQRPLQLRLKPSTGQWFLWKQLLLGDIRKPNSLNEWA